MKHINSGIQQVGIGVIDIESASKWYREHLGFDINVVDDNGTAERMLKYTGGEPQRRHAIIAINIQGGGGLEVWQYKTREPQPADFEIQAGDLGIYAIKIKSKRLDDAFIKMRGKGVKLLSEIETDPIGTRHFFFEDLYGNVFQMVSEKSIFKKSKAYNGGVYGVIVGVSDIDKAVKFYSEILDYDVVDFHKSEVFEDFKGLKRGENRFDRVLLSHSEPRQGAFSNLLGDSRIELIRVYDAEVKRIYDKRFWGDPGFIQVCYEIRNMKGLKLHCERFGHPFTVDSNPDIYDQGGKIFDMGEAAGHFTYIEDPDGTLIEFVETHKIPILKRLGWYLNLMKRKQHKPIPNFMLKTLSWNRIKQ
jgi:catechol 2,3-dioxygenase-like lactoylglutathione lyase family enzyme